ncbi:hypothetical protein FH144_01810 [Staphylococcus caledonicus]|uniref:hypothetical protein n=1 Tax=Staphylococcus sp. acrmy TaxID=2929076 RepID=UPI001F5A1D47|nr:hypothetical protein [Staphylococcus sp. acrmy]MCI2947164.1 hypothetical protein [Staphylococcus sp. acrmy]
MIDNTKDLGKAVKENQDNIEIEVDLGRKVVKIVGAGKVSWLIASGSIASIVIALLVTAGTGGTTAPATGTYAAVAGTSAALTLGPTVTYIAISIAVAGGGMATLNKLRRYKVIEKDDRYILKKK